MNRAKRRKEIKEVFKEMDRDMLTHKKWWALVLTHEVREKLYRRAQARAPVIAPFRDFDEFLDACDPFFDSGLQDAEFERNMLLYQDIQDIVSKAKVSGVAL